jgi:DNA gyrase subunit B
MKELIDRGYIYIAQPPLYRLKRGKSERYIKDEKEFTREVMRHASEDRKIRNSGGQLLEGRTLIKYLTDLGELFALLDKLEKRLRNRQAVELLIAADLDKKADFGEDKTKLEGLEKKFKSLNFKTRIDFDEEHSLNELVFVDSSGGEKRINWELASMPEYKRMRSIAATVLPLDLPPFVAEVEDAKEGAVKVTYKSSRELLESLLSEGKKDFNVQRYKGLGEMRAEQLWDTTMNAETRTLLQVRLEDLTETETIFTTLMGENVEVRRKFIEDNALDVKNLDV